MIDQIKSIIYEGYGGKDLPADPEVVDTRIYVRVGEEQSPLDYEHQYTFRLMTLRAIHQLALAPSERYRHLRSLIIIDRFEYAVVQAAVEAILPEIEFYGIRSD